MLHEYLMKARELEPDLEKLHNLMRIEELEEEIDLLEHKFNFEGWNDVPALQKYNKLLNEKDSWHILSIKLKEYKDFLELLIAEGDEEISKDLIQEYEIIKAEIDKLLLENMFDGKYDHNNVILSIHAGSGGKEAQDWASMLLRMYLRWGEQNGYACRMLDNIPGEFPGSIKSCVLEVKGKNAYGMLKNEAGVHRLIRVSPFDSQNRRHTSFAAIEIIPEIETDTSIQIDPKDLRIDTYRSSGAGGQHVNMTDSAIRITHLPTGLVVTCQDERSQIKNKESAMKVLISRLIQIKEKEHLEEISQIRGEQRQIEWGSQIRTYTFMPYQLVKDHRTNHETGNINSVMDGNINDFIYKSLAK